jgi:hypothetical protein
VAGGQWAVASKNDAIPATILGLLTTSH